MKLKQFLGVLLITVSVLSACKKHGPKPHPNNPDTTVIKRDTDIYVSGYTATQTGTSAAVYWKNGVITKLTTDQSYAEANAITVVGNDVYVGGYATLPGSVYHQPVYWKNGVLNKLPVAAADTVGDAAVCAIAVSGNDVYAVGYTHYNEAFSKAAYWKNGVLTYLADHQLGYQRALGVVLKGNDVYIAGFTTKSSGHNQAVLWVNGVATILSGTIPDQQATGISIHGNDVFISGSVYDQFVIEDPYYERSVYWKNNVFNDHIITDNSVDKTRANAIATQGNDVCIVGETYGTSLASFSLKNGTFSILNQGGSKSTSALGVALSGNNAYVAGYLTDAGARAAVYWRNGVVTKLSEGFDATGIAVMPR